MGLIELLHLLKIVTIVLEDHLVLCSQIFLQSGVVGLACGMTQSRGLIDVLKGTEAALAHRQWHLTSVQMQVLALRDSRCRMDWNWRSRFRACSVEAMFSKDLLMKPCRYKNTLVLHRLQDRRQAGS